MLNRIFVVVVLFLSSAAPARLLFENVEVVERLVWSGIYLVTFFLLVMRWKQFTLVVSRRGKLLLILVGMALVSVLWSSAPAATLLDSVSLLGATLVGCYLAIRYDLSEQLRMLAWTLGIVALLSFLLGLALPDYGVSSDVLTPGDWQGIFGHKNHLGANMALGAVVFLLLIISERRYRLLRLSIFALSLVLLVLSNAMTSIVILLLLVIFLPLYRALRGHHTLAVPLITAALLGSGVVTMWFFRNAETVLGAFGRDLSLTGRMQLWPTVLDMVYERPWLGYGYAGFWQGWEGESAHVWLAMHERVGEPSALGHAHNGFLELMLNLGLLGVLMFTLNYLLAFPRAVTWIRLTNTVEGFWPVTFLTFMFLYNLTETAILTEKHLLWIVYVAVVLSIFVRRSRVGKRQQQEASQVELPTKNGVYSVRHSG